MGPTVKIHPRSGLQENSLIDYISDQKVSVKYTNTCTVSISSHTSEGISTHNKLLATSTTIQSRRIESDFCTSVNAAEILSSIESEYSSQGNDLSDADDEISFESSSPTFLQAMELPLSTMNFEPNAESGAMSGDLFSEDNEVNCKEQLSEKSSTDLGSWESDANVANGGYEIDDMYKPSCFALNSIRSSYEQSSEEADKDSLVTTPSTEEFVASTSGMASSNDLESNVEAIESSDADEEEDESEVCVVSSAEDTVASKEIERLALFQRWKDYKVKAADIVYRSNMCNICSRAGRRSYALSFKCNDCISLWRCCICDKLKKGPLSKITGHVMEHLKDQDWMSDKEKQEKLQIDNLIVHWPYKRTCERIHHDVLN